MYQSLDSKLASQKAIEQHNARDCCEQLSLSVAGSKHLLVMTSLKDRNANQIIDLFVCCLLDSLID